MNKENKVELEGGRIGKIYRNGEKVIRPANVWSPTVHKFLDFMHNNGADFVPMPYGIEKGHEILSYIHGDVFNDPLPDIFYDDSMIVSSALLLKKFHEISKNFIPFITKDCKWMLEPMSPIEVICHGDYAPYNVVIVNDTVKAIIDFDTIHPGSKLWDVSYAIYRWIPFIDGSDDDFEDYLRKIRLFLDVYGISYDYRKEVIKVMIKRLKALTDYMQREAKAGNIDFQRNINDGHLKKYFDDIVYLKKNESRIINGIRK